MTIKTASDWRSDAARLNFRRQAFIDGKTVDALSGLTFPALNPAKGATL